jgi:hypothetical protein
LISEYTFQKTDFAKYLVVLTAVSVLFKMSEMHRTEFLKIVFGDIKTRKIRITENLIISLPFSILLVCHYAVLESIVLTSASAGLCDA